MLYRVSTLGFASEQQPPQNAGNAISETNVVHCVGRVEIQIEM